jgi:hypothetical protein
MREIAVEAIAEPADRPITVFIFSSNDSMFVLLRENSGSVVILLSFVKENMPTKTHSMIRQILLIVEFIISPLII